jgi:neutral ceramidase
MFLIGLGKADITAFERGSGMLGYGMYSHIALDVETPLFARAYVIQDMDKQSKLVIVNCEICFVTPLLKQSVLEYLDRNFPELGITDENLMLSAQHTHCSPAGYSYHATYNIPVPGFVRQILDKLVKGIAEAIVQAEQTKTKATITIGKGRFDDDVPVSFNRTVDSYNQNPEVTKYPFSKRHLAVDREMTLLNFISEEGALLGSINWFAVHTTNLPNNYTKLCSDNKGFAADYLERNFRKKIPNYIGAFAQGACGDVSARVRYNPKLSFQRGKFEGVYSDDLKSSKFNGNLQYEKAKEIIEGNHTAIKNDELDAVLQYVDFSKIDILPEFNNGKTGGVTSPSVMGVAFLEGSIMDGPGMHPIIGNVSRMLANRVRNKELKKAKNTDDKEAEKINRRYTAQGTKHLAMETGEKRLFGFTDIKNFFVPSIADPMIYYLKYFAGLGLLDEHPWAPQILPVQIFKIGTLALAAIPFEITTVASWRLKKTLADTLSQSGIEHVILCPYSNAYNGYITTNEEYQVQNYEGGHCVFGQWSLNALQQISSNLATQLTKKKEDRDIPFLRDAPISQKYLEKFAYVKSIYFEKIDKKLNRKEEKVVQSNSAYNSKVDGEIGF